MIIEKINGINFVYPPQENEDAVVIKQAIQPCVEICVGHWGLSTSQDVWVVLMTDWQMFLDVAAPTIWKPLVWVSKRFQAARFEQIWQIAGGWNQSFGKRVAAGIKPARLITTADRRIGEKIFISETNLAEKVALITYHELTHDLSDYLRLPAWLNEGLAMYTADLCSGKQTVLEETLSRLSDSQVGYITRYQLQEDETLIHFYLRAYWLTRWLEKEHPEILKSWLKKPMHPVPLETQLAQVLGLPQAQMWEQVDGFLAEKLDLK